MMGGILGLPMQMQTFLNGGFMEVMVDCISFTRWSVSMSFLEYLALHPPDEAKLDTINGELLKLFRDHAYTKATFILDVRDGQWWTGVLALLLQGSVLRAGHLRFGPVGACNNCNCTLRCRRAGIRASERFCCKHRGRLRVLPS
ncbi:ABCG24 [Symbiodinium necroappetens]|uniref:ABCG24 protein n=1 Tax=Symbiodinium necroappetens TaxID=1628268 RepID=A0A812K6T1_9DINO|nr:ABCG24 [Symbiodinium necroappetens]